MPQRKPVQKLIVVVGPTAAGKSELAVKMAKKHNGEIISADSRQIYRGLDIGTGKVPGRWRRGSYYYKGIRHHLIDVADPKRQVSAVQFQRLAGKAIREIAARGKLPIICGGTAHWVDAVIFGQKFPQVKPDAKLRKELGKKSAKQLFARLKKLDPRRAAEIDQKNPRRLVRALEIVLATGKAIPELEQQTKFDVTWIGITKPQPILYKKIDARLRQWLKQGLLREVKKLHKRGVSWKRLEELGMDYKYAALHLEGEITYNEMVEKSSFSIKHYAKRQMTWWKRNKDIRWV